MNTPELETRKCKCGCELTFRCLVTSGQRYYSKQHIDISGKQARQDWAYLELFKQKSSHDHEKQLSDQNL